MIVLEPSHKYNELRFAPLLMENSGYMLVTRTGKIDIYDFNPRVKVSIGSVHVPLNDAESQGSSAGSGSDGCEESHGGKGVRSTLAKYTTMCVPERRITLSGYCIKFSKDGSFMTYTMYGKQPMVVIWDVKEQQLRKAVNLEVKKFDVTICPNSRLIATASNSSGLIRVWKAADGHCVSVFGVAEDKVDNVIFSPNSTRLAVQYRKGERLHQIYDIPTGQTIFSLSNSYHPRA
jgi:WD40 repeat protein